MRTTREHVLRHLPLPLVASLALLAGCSAPVDSLAEGSEGDDFAATEDALASLGPFRELGLSVSKADYDYGASVMLDGDGKYKMWWCGSVPSGGDGIWYADSVDNQVWSTPRLVLRSAGAPYQGIHACDPSVVKTSAGVYHLYFTSDGNSTGVGSDNSIFLATSPDGVTFTHANGGRPVISLTSRDGSYGIGQSSVMLIDGRFVHFYTDTSKGPTDIYVAESTNGLSFSLANRGVPVLRNVAAVDVKYLARSRRFVVAAEGPQWSVGFRLLSRSFVPLQSSTPPAGTFGMPCNHNPGLLGDSRGYALGEVEIGVYYGSGTTTSSINGPCWNPASWEIRRGVLALAGGSPQACRPGGTTPCTVANGVGGKTCNAAGTAYGSCLASSCNAGYALVSGGCQVSTTTVPSSGHYSPVGWLDGVANGVASGWACDPDQPANSISVTFSVGGPAGSGAPAYTVKASESAEPAVSNECGGGTAHRFSFALPNWIAFRGQPVHAYGIDLTSSIQVQLRGSPRTIQ